QEVRSAASSLSTAPIPEIARPEPENEKSPISNEEYPGYKPEGPNWRVLYTALVLALVLPISAFALWKYVGNSPYGAGKGVSADTDPSQGVLEIVFAGGVQVFINDEF